MLTRCQSRTHDPATPREVPSLFTYDRLGIRDWCDACYMAGMQGEDFPVLPARDGLSADGVRRVLRSGLR